MNKDDANMQNEELFESDIAEKDADVKESKKNDGKKKNKKAVIIGISAAVVVVLAVVAIILAVVFGNAKVPGKNNDDELEVAPDTLTIIQDGDEVKKEDVTAITGATNSAGEVVDDKGIIDMEGHKIYATGQKNENGYMIYTTGKVDSKGNILYTLNKTNSFGKLLYYTGKYIDGKLVLTPTQERPDYSSNNKPNPYKPEPPKTTVTVPLNTESDVVIKGMQRDYIKFFGGKGMDNFNAVSPCKDGGYVVAAYSNSYDGDFMGVSKEWGGHCAVIKYDAVGNVLWKYNLGADSEVWFNDVTELKDGTIIAVGFTMSAETEPAKLSKDHSAIIVRLKKNGDHMWTYVFPGSKEEAGEFIQCVEATPDGGFVVGGKAESNSGFFKGGANARKAFIFKFDKNCNIKWRRILSGSMSNNIMGIDVNNSGDVFATCVTMSNDGDFAGLSYDAKLGAANSVLVKLNKNGDLQWKKYLENSGNSEYKAVCATDDGGCVVAGSYTVSKRADGIYTMTYGKSDGYAIRYDKDGNVHWARVIGGQGADYISAITEIDGGFVIVGRTTSTNGDFAGEVVGGGSDGFIMYLNEQGLTSAKLIFEGKTEDTVSGVCMLDDGTVVVAGSTTSKDGFFRESGASNYEGYVAKFTAQQ